MFVHRFFPTHDNLACKFETLRNLDRKMTSRHGKTPQQPLFVGLYLPDPCLTSCKFETLRKKVLQAFQGHQDHRKPTSGATSAVCGKTDKSKEIMLEIWHVFPRGGRLCARILPYSLRVDLQVWNFKKEDMCSHNVQFSDRQELPQFGRNLDRKTAFRHGKTLRQPLFAGPYLSNPSSTSRKSKTLRNKVSQAFQGHQDHWKPTSGAMSIVRGKTDENKKNVLEIWRVFPLGQPPSRIYSSLLATSQNKTKWSQIAYTILGILRDENWDICT